jgi:4-amino-4-deoxy-L-arabinose transferase-like glycosyltransferase
MAWLGLGLVMAVLFYLQLGSYPLFDVDEPRYAEAAREMLARGNWITPYFNDVVRFDKPVMFYWLIAGSYKLFGINEFAARLVSAMAATGTVGLTAWAASRWGSPRWALMAGLMLASCLEVTGLARMSVTDMTLTLWLTGCSWCLLGTVLETPRWWVLAGVFSGLALLTKGPVGLVLPGAIVVVYSLLVGRFKATFTNGWFALGTLLAVAIAAPWYMAAGGENGMAFWNALVFHNVDRFSTVVSGHKQFPFFYPVVLIAGFLPWSVYLPATLAQWLPQFKTFWQQLKQNQASGSAELTAYLALYCLVWAVGVYGFFEASQTKLLTYILPMFPAIAVLVSGAFWQQATHPITHPKAASALSTSGVLLWLGLLLGGVFFINNMSQFMPREAREISGGFENVGAVLILLAGTGLSVLAILNRRWMGAIWAQSIAMAALVAFALYNIVPNVSQVAQGAMLRYAEVAQSAPLVTYGIVRPSLTFYARHRIAAFDLESRDQLWAHLAQQVVQAKKQHTSEKVYVVTKARLAGKLTRSMPTGWHMQVVESPAESGGVYTLLKLTYHQAKPLTGASAPLHPKR